MLAIAHRRSSAMLQMKPFHRIRKLTVQRRDVPYDAFCDNACAKLFFEPSQCMLKLHAIPLCC